MQPRFAEQFNAARGGIVNGKRRLKEVIDFNPATDDAAMFEQDEVFGLFGPEILADEPRLEIFGDLFLARLDLERAEGCADEIHKVATGLPVGAAQIVFVEIIFRTVQVAGANLPARPANSSSWG